MESALRFRIEAAKKRIERLQEEREITTHQYALGLIDGQIMAEKGKVSDLEDMLRVNEYLQNQSKLREVI